MFLICALALIAGACNGSPADDTSLTPPPIPDGAATVAFERTTEPEADASIPAAPPKNTKTGEQKYWGVKDGEVLILMWEDLMPEGSEEQLAQEYEAFYAMLEQRYAANTTSLADADPYGAIAEGSEFDFMPQLGNFDTVEALNGEHVRIPGYIVPFDFNSKFRQREFLFVPYMGACIHTPPPPPNQIIFIRADPPVRVQDIWVPYWIEGILSTEKTESDLANTAYTLEMNLIEPYGAP
jgi:hypothetical protein